MLRVPLVTILAREMRAKICEVDRALEVLRVPLGTIDIGARNAIENDPGLEMLRVPLVTMVAREVPLEIFLSRLTLGDVLSAANHDSGARNAIQNLLKSTIAMLLRCCECRWSRDCRENCD